MASICPGCGKKFGIFDRIAGVPVCLACEKAGVQVPRSAVWKEESKTDLITGWCLALGALAFVAFVLIVPGREGAPRSATLRLVGYAMIPLSAGIAMIAKARARLRHK